MPKRADGPAKSGGYRFGGHEALRAGLPPKAADPRSKPSEKEFEARQTLAKFAAYRERTGSIGKPLPSTRGISDRRKASLERISEVQANDDELRTIVLREGKTSRLKWIYSGGILTNFLIEEDQVLGTIKFSKRPYPSKREALDNWKLGRVRWD